MMVNSMVLASQAGNTSYGVTTYNDSVVNQSVYIENSLYGFTNSLIHWYTINMRAGITTSSPAETCRQQARNLLGGDNVTTEGALIKLADAFLDAREWRLEEVRILRQQQEELRETREYLFRLARALGEDVPTRVTRATGGYPGGGSRKNRTKHTGKVAVYG